MKQNLILLAFALLVLGNLFATFSDVLIKVLGQSGGIYQYLLFRQLFLFLVITPVWLMQSRASRAPGNLKVHGLRGVLGNIGGAGAVVALLYLPLATANVLFYAAPIITLLLAAWLLKEPIKRHRIIAMAMGFMGIVIAMGPGNINFAALAALATALCVAIFNLSVRWLPDSTTTLSTLFWSNLMAMPITGTIALFNWQAVTQDLLLLGAGTCLCVLVYQGCCIIAFRKADAGAIAIAEYSGLVFAALLGWTLFSEALDQYTILGICLIILPIVWQSFKEKDQPQSQSQHLADSSLPHPDFLAQGDGEHELIGHMHKQDKDPCSK